MRDRLLLALGAVIALLSGIGQLCAEDAIPPAIRWETDYATAYRAAESQQKMLVIYFADAATSEAEKAWEADMIASSVIRGGLEGAIALRVPLAYEVADDEGKSSRLLGHTAFVELRQQRGLAMIDFRDPEKAHYGRVVTILPCPETKRPTIAQLAALFELPAGSLTQRTMIWAIRIHPDLPASTTGRCEPILTTAAETHSQLQANIRRQGHHHWQTRFHQLNARLGNGLVTTEVCAESWPGESLVDAARECVRCWRLSPGHWNSVSRASTAYGYDIKRGSNGIWYATGIFGR